MNQVQPHLISVIMRTLVRPLRSPLSIFAFSLIIASLLTTRMSSARAEGYYKLTLTHLSVNEQRANGKAWDLRGGLPDLFISVYINGATVIQRPLGRDTASVNVEVESEAFDIVGHVKLEVIVYDKDLSEDDYIDNLTALIRPQELGELTYQKGLIKRVDFTLSLTRAGEESVARQVAELKAETEVKARQEAEARTQEAIEAKQRAEAEARVEREARIAAEARARDGAQPNSASPGEPKTEEPKTEEPKAEEPKAEEPKAREPKAE